MRSIGVLVEAGPVGGTQDCVFGLDPNHVWVGPPGPALFLGWISLGDLLDRSCGQ
jgi:hypothetical protein